MKNMGIGLRLNFMVVFLLSVTCISIIIISTFLFRNALEKEILTNSLPAKVNEVVAIIDKQLVSPATTLEAVANHPWLVGWIKNGEDPESLPLVFKASRKVAAMHNTIGVNLIIRSTANYYEFVNGQETTKKLDPEIDGWFFAFEKSRASLQIDVYGPGNGQYSNMAFIDRRIEDGNGTFLGLLAIGLDVRELLKHIASSRIGKKGETFLVGKDGKIMLHAVQDLNGKQLSDIKGFASFSRDILQKDSMTFETVDASGEELFVSTRSIPVLNAVVVTVANVSELLADVNKAWLFSAVVGGGVLLVSFLFSTFFAKTITKPITHILHYAENVAAEREAVAPASSSIKEVEKLRLTLNTIVQSMAERFRQVQEKNEEAEQALSRNEIALTEAQQSKLQAEAKQESMYRVAEQLEKIVSVVSSASEQLSAQIEQSSKGAEQQAERVAETATAMEEMNGAVLEVARNAGQASELSGQAKEKAQAGAKIVRETGESMTALQQQSEALKADMNELDEHATSISQIMGVISDIADQTNLLALNAAIEAARAGEAGRGFAVVADEVRKLAEKTMDSTADVSKAITEIQESATKNIRQVERTGTVVEQVMEKAKMASDALSEIVTLVDDSSDQVRAIATASEEQSATSEEINRSVTEVNTISSETAQAMRESAQAVTALSRQAQELTILIQEMKNS